MRCQYDPWILRHKSGHNYKVKSSKENQFQSKQTRFLLQVVSFRQHNIVNKHTNREKEEKSVQAKLLSLYLVLAFFHRSWVLLRAITRCSLIIGAVVGGWVVHWVQ